MSFIVFKGYKADEENILNVHSSGAKTIEKCVYHNMDMLESGYAWSQVEFYHTEIGFFCFAYNPWSHTNDLYLFYVYPERRDRKEEQLELALQLSTLPLWACVPHGNEKCNKFYKKHSNQVITLDNAKCYELIKGDR